MEGGEDFLSTGYGISVAPRMLLLNPISTERSLYSNVRPDHTADEQVEAVVELSQSALDSLGLKPRQATPQARTQ
jgi:hypothetical protein